MICNSTNLFIHLHFSGTQLNYALANMCVYFLGRLFMFGFNIAYSTAMYKSRKEEPSWVYRFCREVFQDMFEVLFQLTFVQCLVGSICLWNMQGFALGKGTRVFNIGKKNTTRKNCWVSLSFLLSEYITFYRVKPINGRHKACSTMSRVRACLW